MNKHILLSVVALLMVCGACKKTDGSAEKPILAVSIDPQKKLLEDVAGPEFQVLAVMTTGANPETFEPTVTQRMQASKASAYFPIGYLPFEKTIEAELKDRTFNTTAGIEPVMDTHSHGRHTHTVADPHVWTSARNSQIMARGMAEALSELYPQKKDEFSHRADSVINSLQALDAQIAEAVANGNQAFLIWHPSLSYFARDYGLKQISVGQESKEAPLGVLAEIVKQAKADSVQVFFFQKEFDSRQAKNLSNELGIDIIEINPLAYEWEEELLKIANEIATH